MKACRFSLLILASLNAVSQAAPIIRSNTADALNVTTAWIGAPPALPGTNDTATWDASQVIARRKSWEKVEELLTELEELL
jgi:hypothetical protein